MTEQAWQGGSFDGAARALRRRVAGWSPAERLAWLDAAVLDAHRAGALAASRERKQRAVMAQWHR